MLGTLIIICLFGLLVASSGRFLFGNPFQVYFIVWSLLLLALWNAGSTFLPINEQAYLLLIVAKLLSLTILILTQKFGAVCASESRECPVNAVSSGILWLIFTVVLIGGPFVYQRAVELSGSDVFTVIGYMRLRAALTEDVDAYGPLAYLTMPAFVISSVCVSRYVLYRKDLILTIVSLGTSLFYTYLSTGRTFVLLLLILVVAPLVILGRVQLKGVFFTGLLLVSLFLFVAAMTSKGVSVEADLVENAESVLEGLRAYTVAPLVAFSHVVGEAQLSEWGANSFRFFFALANRFGVLDAQPVALVRDYVYVPDPTNVYTVYEVYFSDFSYFGILIPPLFLIGHWWLYGRAVSRGGVWVFYAGASMYPLVMQFFQDQYVSILSQWIQLVFWYWLFVKSGSKDSAAS